MTKDARRLIIQDAEKAVEKMLTQYNQGVKNPSGWAIMRVLERLVMVAKAQELVLGDLEGKVFPRSGMGEEILCEGESE